MKDVQYSYSSLQVNLPDTLTKDIIAWGKEHIPDDEIFHDKINPTFGRENEIHVTVLYGLHSNSSNETRRLLREQKPFPVKLGKIRTFHNKPYDVVVVAVIESPALLALNKRICDHVKYTNKFHNYKPHITIAYVKEGEGKKYTGLSPFNNRQFTADHVWFSSAKGDKERIVFEESLSFRSFMNSFASEPNNARNTLHIL